VGAAPPIMGWGAIEGTMVGVCIGPMEEAIIGVGPIMDVEAIPGIEAIVGWAPIIGCVAIMGVEVIMGGDAIVDCAFIIAWAGTIAAMGGWTAIICVELIMG